MKHSSAQSLLNICLLTLAFVLSQACQRSEFDSKVEPSTTSDMQKASISLAGDPVADGMTPINVYVWLRNYKGDPVIGQFVEIEVSGTGNTIIACTVTDAEGKATCGLITTVAEKKMVTLKGTNKYAPAEFMSPKAVLDGGTFVAMGDSQVTSTGARLITSASHTGAFEGRDQNGIVVLRSTNLGSILADVQ